MSPKDEKQNVARRKCHVSHAIFCATFYERDSFSHYIFCVIYSMDKGRQIALLVDQNITNL